MTTRSQTQIILQIRQMGLKSKDTVVTPEQLGQLASAIETVLRDIGFASSTDREVVRKSIQAMVAGVERLKSSKNLPPALALAMLSRWCDGDNPYAPTELARKEIPLLLRELALQNGQLEMTL